MCIFSQQDKECWNVDEPDPKATYTHMEFLNLKGDRQSLVLRTINRARSHAIPTKNKGKRHIGQMENTARNMEEDVMVSQGLFLLEKCQTNTRGDSREKSRKQHQYACFYSRVLPCSSVSSFPDWLQCSLSWLRRRRLSSLTWRFLVVSFVFTIVDLELFSELINGTNFLVKHLRPKDSHRRHKVIGQEGDKGDKTARLSLCVPHIPGSPPPTSMLVPQGFVGHMGLFTDAAVVSYNCMN